MQESKPRDARLHVQLHQAGPQCQLFEVGRLFSPIVILIFIPITIITILMAGGRSSLMIVRRLTPPMHFHLPSDKSRKVSISILISSEYRMELLMMKRTV